MVPNRAKPLICWLIRKIRQASSHDESSPQFNFRSAIFPSHLNQNRLAALITAFLFCFLLLLQSDVKLTATSLLLLSTSTATMVSLCSWLIGISDSYFCFPISLYLYLRRIVAHVYVSRKHNITVRHFPVSYSSVMQ